MRVTSRTGSARRIWGISKKVRELKARHRTRRFDFWGSLRRDELARYGRRARWGPDKKASIKKKLSLSLCRRTFKLKGNKRFIPELRSRYVFFVFRDSYVLCMYVRYEPSMSISHIAVSWLWYSTPHSQKLQGGILVV